MTDKDPSAEKRKAGLDRLAELIASQRVSELTGSGLVDAPVDIASIKRDLSRCSDEMIEDLIKRYERMSAQGFVY